MLLGKTVRLRALEPKDVDVLYRWENNPSVWTVSNTTVPYSRKVLEAYVDSITDIYADKQLRLVIESITDEKPLGLVDLFEFEPFHLRAGVGVLIADEKDRNKGYASEALDLVIDYVFERLGLRILFCNILEGNKSSEELFKNKGFVEVGRKEEWVRTGHQYVTEVLYCLKNNG